MNSVIPIEKAIETIVLLSSAPVNDDLDELLLKKHYQQWLLKIQLHCPILNDKTEFIEIDNSKINVYDGYFKREDRVDYEDAISSSIMYPSIKDRIVKIKEGLIDLREKEPLKASLFDLVINTVIFDQNTRGGTSVNPNYVGVMGVHHDMRAEKEAVPELLLHEMTHNLLFLDELRYQHYKNYELLKQNENKMDSPYLNTVIQLPLDRILHRMVVFVEILEYRNKHIGHSVRESQHLSSDIIRNTCHQYISQIEGKNLTEKLLTDRGQKIFESCRDYFNISS